ncbi:MAG: 50S ribosome-binding GTPase [Myxococcales bacterium]|nr:50S ribosome-binding GTPase [Myxococcales bacterium]
MSDVRRPEDPHGAAEALDGLDELLRRIPGASKIVGEVRDLRALLVQSRVPRVAALGRRGAGKSALGNALLGVNQLAVGAVEDTTREAALHTLTVQGRALDWVDTPGLRAGDAPTRREAVRGCLLATRPDAVLLCFRASEVGAGLDEDVATMRAVLQGVERLAGGAPRCLAVVTRVDELAPRRVKAPPYDQVEAKRAAIEAAVGAVRRGLAAQGLSVDDVVPVGAYQRFDADGAREVDWRWNLETLSVRLFELLPREAQLEAARAIERGWVLRRRVAMRLVGAATSVAMAVGATPLPVADLALLVPLQAAMLSGVVYASGRRLGPRTLTEWLGGLGLGAGLGMALREAVRAVLRVVPAIGTTVSGAVAASGTWALGVAAVRHFVDGASVAESRARFDEALAAGPGDETEAPDEGEGEP